jgi:predicted  nucleic acid-binding Zn-ribbon protein
MWGSCKSLVKEDLVKNILSSLIELQRIDSELLRIDELKGDLPNQVIRLNQELENAKQALKEKEEQLQSCQKERSISEMIIKELEEKKVKYQTQLYEVKNNKEYDAVTHEIEGVKGEIDQKESRIIELMDIEEQLKEEVKATQDAFNELSKQFKEKSASLNKLSSKTEKDEARLLDLRNKLLPNIDERHFNAYQRISKAKNGLAVVPIVRDACGGCSRRLPPQRILEIRKMNRLFVCEVCSRILFWDEEKAKAPV